MRFAIRIAIAIAFSAMFFGPMVPSSDALPNGNAKIALHVKAVTSKSATACSTWAPKPSCDIGESTLVVSAPLGNYFVYLLATDIDDSLDVGSGLQRIGLSGVQFGITYDGGIGSGVDVNGWHRCTDGIEVPGDNWPASGSGTTVTWETCEEAPAAGDLSGGVTRVVGYFDVTAYSADVLSVVAYPQTGVLSVSDCNSFEMDLEPLRRAGKVKFGTDAGGSFDPCNPYSALSYFDSLSGSQLDSVAVKLSYLSGQRVSLGAFILAAAGGPEADFSTFAPFALYSPGAAYPHEPDPPASPPVGYVQPSALGVLIDSLASLDLQFGRYPHGNVSLTLVATGGGTPHGFEAVLDSSKMAPLYATLVDLFSNETSAWNLIREFGCSSDYLPASTMSDVTSQVEMTDDGFRFDRSTRTYVTTLRVKNISGSSISGPLVVSIDVPTPIQLANGDGYVCRLAHGAWFKSLSSGGLGGGEETSLVLRFSHNSAEPIRMQTWLYSGSGMR